MPGGVPVGTLAIGRAGAINAALLAASILGLQDDRRRALDARAARTAAVPEAPADPGEGSERLAPGAVIGILGGGQLGRMTALAAARLGYRTHVFAPEPDGPAAQVTNSRPARHMKMQRRSRGSRVRST